MDLGGPLSCTGEGSCIIFFVRKLCQVNGKVTAKTKQAFKNTYQRLWQLLWQVTPHDGDAIRPYDGDANKLITN